VKRPGWWFLARDRGAVEIKEFMRSREQMIFIFAFPVMLLVLFGAIFGGTDVSKGVSFGQYFLAGMIASGIMNTGFQSLALGIASDRDTDVLKRLHGTPLPPTAFFAGKLMQVLFVSVVQIAVLIAVGVAAYDVDLPTSWTAWGTFAWVFLLGTAASVALGIGMSSALRNARAGSAILTPVVLFLQFISGVFIVYTQVPPFLQHVASVFPLKWLAQGMRSVFLPADFETAEATGSWQHGATAIILAVWFVIGTLWAVRTFRWQRPEDR
jgi:ABC-2 type transport system permease protein